ncbi:MAG: nicotinate (nicotinamide) nucleotide adenylyltransferase [Puniceicoccaceae bacterium]|nr:nicotinate (nicotinamide) nucleotide adenylyltransferase [Puniceicoccaceae bacterium]
MKPTNRQPVRTSLGLYGGSFDPVHSAHLRVAQLALEQLSLDKVVFIPAACSPLKSNPTVASDRDRIEMLELATAGEPRFEIDACEIERGGSSYAVDTVSLFRQRYSQCALHWIIGADQLELLPNWHRIDDLALHLTFVVLRRPGYCLDAPSIPGLQLIELEAPLMEHSSSEIRRRLEAGLPCTDLLPCSVEAFISSRGLYTR